MAFLGGILLANNFNRLN